MNSTTVFGVVTPVFDLTSGEETLALLGPLERANFNQGHPLSV
jgi:hypothetical protein